MRAQSPNSGAQRQICVTDLRDSDPRDSLQRCRKRIVSWESDAGICARMRGKRWKCKKIRGIKEGEGCRIFPGVRLAVGTGLGVKLQMEKLGKGARSREGPSRIAQPFMAGSVALGGVKSRGGRQGLSSLMGLAIYGAVDPAMNGWAIVGIP